MRMCNILQLLVRQDEISEIKDEEPEYLFPGAQLEKLRSLSMRYKKGTRVHSFARQGRIW